jgi:hypothetical protein
MSHFGYCYYGTFGSANNSSGRLFRGLFTRLDISRASSQSDGHGLRRFFSAKMSWLWGSSQSFSPNRESIAGIRLCILATSELADVVIIENENTSSLVLFDFQRSHTPAKLMMGSPFKDIA